MWAPTRPASGSTWRHSSRSPGWSPLRAGCRRRDDRAGGLPDGPALRSRAEMLTRVHHVGLVVRRLEDGLALWQDVLGLRVSKQATVVDQGVKAALLPIGRSEIELLEPVNPAGGVAKFLEKRGEGLHHVCFETPDVTAELAAARAQQFPLIDEAPRAGLAGMICFLHPKGTRGVLVEFATPPPGEHAPPPN